MSKFIEVNWPKYQSINLGNIIVFRKELELLSIFYNASTVKIYFSQELSYNNEILLPYDEILRTSNIRIDYSFTTTKNSVWPPIDLEISDWNYGSFKRIYLLLQQLKLFPSLEWSSKILNQARLLLQRIRSSAFHKVFAVHLKNQSGGPEESNASFIEWGKLFSSYSRIAFVLLGNDEINHNFDNISNIFRIEQNIYPIVVQLAFCSICDGFLGMASGISAAAILSHTPYVVFKHPLHHVSEMLKELGDRDYVDFALSKQKILRKVDSYENLKKALESLL